MRTSHRLTAKTMGDVSSSKKRPNDFPPFGSSGGLPCQYVSSWQFQSVPLGDSLRAREQSGRYAPPPTMTTASR